MKKLLLVFSLFVCCIAQAKKIIDGQEKTVVFVGIVGDLFHAGHVRMLQRAREFGDYLIVGITADEGAQSYKRLPIMIYHERVAVVKACKYVDEVITDTLDMSEEFIEHNGIDIVVHGDDMSQETLKIFYSVPMQKGILRVLPYTPGISTSAIIRRILERAEELRN